MVTAAAPSRARQLVAEVRDPELPMITIADLGILRDVRVESSGHVVVDITPTYSGCPAMDVIRADVLTLLAEHGMADAEVRTVLAPAWSTDLITAAGHAALRRHGIAPPAPRREHHDRAGVVELSVTVRCPRCGSPDTEESARFGSTPCKGLWVCLVCREPFDHMKTL